MFSSAVRIVLTTAAAVAVVVPVSRAVVERDYSDRMYVALQHTLSSASNRTPLALLDVLLAVVLVAWVFFAARDLVRAKTRMRAAARIVVRSIVWSAAAYLLFLATWGLNYRRVPLREKLPYDESAITADAAFAAARASVDRLNALHARAHAAGWPAADAIDPQLASGFARALRETRLPDAVPGRPKRTALDWYFRRSGTDGMTDPIFLETLVSTSVLPFERPFVAAHEWTHLAGIGDEGEANFVGWLACMRGGDAAQYSGTLFIYRELAAVVAARERSALTAALADGPRADLRAIRARYEREVSPRLAEAGWRIYDSYLRANHVEAGAASYAEVVKLVLGVKLDEAGGSGTSGRSGTSRGSGESQRSGRSGKPGESL